MSVNTSQAAPKLRLLLRPFSFFQARIAPGISPATPASSSLRASRTNTPTTWSASSSSWSPPAWMSPSTSSPSTWRTTPSQEGRGSASTTGWRCGTGSPQVRLPPPPTAVRGLTEMGGFSLTAAVSQCSQTVLPCPHHYRLRWSSNYFRRACW